ncbi:MAG: hypothetical protein MJZ05_02795 [Fibrobacter sp.]|nr:hypothetical protein [Fibrobacter sp.]
MRKILLSLFLILTSYSMAYEFRFKPFFMQIKDSKGQTIAEAVSKIYAGKVRVDARAGRCYYFQPQYRANDVEYEIDHCSLEYRQEKIYSQADHLNGIDIKGRIWIQGNSYRTRPVGGEWSRWQDTQMMAALTWGNKTGMNFRKEKGEFIFILDVNLKKIHDRPGPIYIPEQRKSATPKEKPQKGYVEIRESGSGKKAYYEER